MNKIYPILFFLLVSAVSFAGNPDRQGEAGANQLLINPWARAQVYMRPILPERPG